MAYWNGNQYTSSGIGYHTLLIHFKFWTRGTYWLLRTKATLHTVHREKWKQIFIRGEKKKIPASQESGEMSLNWEKKNMPCSNKLVKVSFENTGVCQIHESQLSLNSGNYKIELQGKDRVGSSSFAFQDPVEQRSPSHTWVISAVQGSSNNSFFLFFHF